MASTFIFDNREIYIPGVYTRFQADIETEPLRLTSGNALIIDTGLSSSYAIGSGVSGSLKQGKDSLYTYSRQSNFQNAIAGGPLWKLSEILFNPAPSGRGVSSLSYIKAAETTVPTLSIALDSGNIPLTSKFEGESANGTITSGNLVSGFGFRMSAGVSDPAAYIFTFYRGTYKGDNSSLTITGSQPIGGVEASASIPKIVAQSPEVTTAEELVEWMSGNADFNFFFSVGTVTATGAILAADLTAYADYTGFAGGTDNYTTDALDAALDAVKGENIDYVLLLDSGVNALSADNLRIKNFFISENSAKSTLVAGGYEQSNQLRGGSSSIQIAQSFDNEQVIVHHGGIKLPDITSPDKLVDYNALTGAAFELGLRSGLPVSTPATFKPVQIFGLVHRPTDQDFKDAFKAGISLFREDGSQFIVAYDLNSIQKNTNIVNNGSGTSFAPSIVAQKRQLDKEIRADLYETFLKTEVGPNVFTVSPSAVKSRVNKLLKDRINVIIAGFDPSKTTAVIVGDSIQVTYEYSVLGPMNFILVTSTIVG